MGGTCAVDLDGDASRHVQRVRGHRGRHRLPTREQSIRRSPTVRRKRRRVGGFDPTTVITHHGPYTGVAGWFDVNGTTPAPQPATAVNAANNGGDGHGGRDPAGRSTGQTAAANSLCELGTINGIHCAVVAQDGKHDWPFAAHAFVSALPWLAGQIGTPGVPRKPLRRPRPRRPRFRRRRGDAASVVGLGGQDFGEERVGARSREPIPWRTP